MNRYNAWYNGSTTVTLTGNPDECPDETQGPISNALAIGGMTVPGNTSLDRTTYDKNPFYAWIPHESGDDIALTFQSSTDYYIDETQMWTMSAVKSGDGFDVSGHFIATRPSDNSYSFTGTKCWNGGNYFPQTSTSNKGNQEHWNITGHLTRDSATWTLDRTIIDTDDVEWHVLIKFEGNAWSDGPRLVTTGDVPTTEGCVGCDDAEEEDDPSSTATGTGTATRTGSSSSSSSTSSSGSKSGSSSSSSTTGAGSRLMLNLSGMGLLSLFMTGVAVTM